MSKILVAYFSASGVTKKVASLLAETVNGDLFEIQPKVPYTSADLDWTDRNSRSSREMKDKTSRPEIANKTERMQEYDIVFLGFPIWWYTAPTIVNAFLESYDFSGKTVIPFATSGSSGFGNTLSSLKPSCSESTKWKEGKMLNGKQTKDSLAAWIKTVL